MHHESWLHLNSGTDIELRFQGDEFLGLGNIRIGGVPVRDGRWPLCPRIETPEGFYFHRFELLEVVETGTGVVLRTRAHSLPLPRQYRADWYRPIVPTALPVDAPAAEVDWLLNTRELSLDGERFAGFGYAFRFQGNGCRIHRLTDWGTFELGGTADGVLLVSRTATRPPEHNLSLASRFTTAEEYGPNREQPDGFYRQLMPRFGMVQCFDYQWRPEATLLLAYERPAYINSLVQKNAGEPWIQVVDEHWFPLAAEVTTPAHWVLLHQPAAAERLHQGRTRWMRCWQWSRKHYSAALKMPVTKPFLMCQVADYATPGQPDTGVDILRAVRDEVLPAAARFGFNAVYFEPWWECNASQPNAVSGCASGVASSLSVCAPFDYRFAAGWGGDALMKEVADAGRRLGVKAMPWLAIHLANRLPDSPLFRDHPEWRITDYNGAPYDGDYGDLCSGDLNGPFGEHFADCVRHAVEQVGVQAWFFDSYSNLTVQPINFRDPLLRPQIEKVWELQRYCLQHGVAWTIEADGPFGHGCFGMALTRQAAGAAAAIEDFSGDHAYSLLDANHRFGHSSTTPDSFPTDTFYRSLACGGPLCPSLSRRDPGLWQWITPDIQRWLRAYRLAENDMLRPTLLPDDLGILWDNPGANSATRILWAFRDGTFDLATPTPVAELPTGDVHTAATSLRFRAGTCYRLRP